jgi:hypothetical protein
MTQQTWFSGGGERVREAFEAALAWCEGCCVVSDAPTSADRADALWLQLTRSAERVRAAILTNLEAGDAELIAPLYAAARVRRFLDSAHHGHFVWFERGDQVRFLLAPAALRSLTVEGPAPWLYWEGARSALPEGSQATFDAAWTSSVPTDQAEILGGPQRSPVDVPYSRPIPSVREVLGIRSTRDYFELEESDQELALWSALIGEGSVDLEQAIRLCAERLRAQGFLEYQRLHQDGRVYAAIEERLLAARRRTDLFDRPRSGFVRAIQPDLDQLIAEQWRDCLMGALERGAHVDRDEAVRLGFENAQTTYGVNAQRLRSGGRADQALRSAINSAVRQGYLQRDGAAYLIRVAPGAAPTLRGIVTAEAPGEVEPDAAAQEPVVATPPDTQATPPAPADAANIAVPVAAETNASEAQGADAPPKPDPEPIAPLDRDVQTLPLPTRTLNWCARREVATVRELVAWQPEAFKDEKNVGRGTVRETREVIESLLGYTWEEAYIAVHGGAPGPSNQAADATNAEDEAAADSLTAGGPSGWVQLGAQLSEEDRGTSLLDIQLPTRMKNFVKSEGLERLGDLFKLSYASLAGTANLGRKSLNDTIGAVRELLSERASPPVYTTFLQAWQAQLSGLEPIPRMIVTRRAGMHGERETLEELGAMLGITRERVRQIEARVLERLSERSRWRRLVEANLISAFGSARALPLDLLARDGWWMGIEQQELLLDYVVRRIFEDQLFVLEAPSGRRYLTKFGPNDFVAHLESAKNRVAKLEYPVEARVIDDIVRSEADALDPVLFDEFRQAVGELLLRDTANPELALGYGRYRADDVIAFLNGQPEPVHVDVLEEHCGRGALPDEVLHFKRGFVGLKRHFPDFDDWSARLVPVALEIMQERPAGRQWLVPELHDALRERGLLPDWLGHWHLASLLRLSGQVEYLGRLRVALKDGGQEVRLQYVELLQCVLETAGAPISFEDLLGRARLQSDIPEASATLRVAAAPFVRIDDTRIGLVERDIPGGPQAVATAVEAVVRALTETQLGLTPHQATLLVNGLSDVHATWARQLVTSVLRNESTIRIDRTKNIGLDEWDDVRCPTRPEFLRREVQQAGGRLPLAKLYSSMDAFYGRAPDRGSLGVMAQQVGLTIVGDNIMRAVEAAPAPAVERVGINLSGIPTELREKFQELVSEPIADVATLRAQVKQHVDTMAEAYQVNEFVDLPGAHLLADQSNLLLDSWETLSLSDRHLAHAAVRYFVSWDDVTNDLDIGGLDDDKQIMKAVLSYLGIEKVADGALAS